MLSRPGNEICGFFFSGGRRRERGNMKDEQMGEMGWRTRWIDRYYGGGDLFFFFVGVRR